MQQNPAAAPSSPASRFKSSPAVLLLAVTAALFGVFSDRWLVDLSNPVRAGLLFAWLVGAIVWGRSRPCGWRATWGAYGTLILTLSAQSIKVMTLAMMMLSGLSNPTLARNTIFSVAMIVLNGLLGLSLLLGGGRFHEQEYNLRGVNAYLSLILTLAVFALLLLNFTNSSAGPSFSRAQEGFVILMRLGLYGVFLLVQTNRHRGLFRPPAQYRADHRDAGVDRLRRGRSSRSPLQSRTGGLSGQAARPGPEPRAEGSARPDRPRALVVAIAALSPEGLRAIRAALRNELQRSVNV
jgi:Ca2+:H+ antiporter